MGLILVVETALWKSSDPEDNHTGCAAAHKSYLMIPNYDSLTNADLNKIVKAINAVDKLLCDNSSSSLPA